MTNQMKIVALILMAGFAPACGDSPSSSGMGELSLDEYLEVCSSNPFTVGGEFDLDRYRREFDELIKTVNSANPPSDVKPWHDALLAFFQAVRQGLDEGPRSGEGDEEFAYRVAIYHQDIHDGKLIEAIRQMEAETQERMQNAHCINAGQIAAAEETGERPQ